MKKYLAIAILSFILGCLATSPKIDIAGSVDSIIIKADEAIKLSILLNEMKSVTESYKAEVYKAEVNKKEVITNQVLHAGIGDIFGCTPSKPKESKKPEREVTPAPPVKVIPAPPVKVTPEVTKPKIISVKGEQKLVDGRMMFTKINVKLNKEGLDKVKKGAKVRIFIDYCYYESGTIEKDGTVGFNIDWHPPLTPVKGKVGVSLFMQTNNPEIGSGVQYTSIVINT